MADGWACCPSGRSNPSQAPSTTPPQVADEESRPLACRLSPPDWKRIRDEAEVRVRRRAAEIVDFFVGVAAGDRHLAPGERERLVDRLVERASEEQPDIVQTLVAAMAPYRLPEGWE